MRRTTRSIAAAMTAVALTITIPAAAWAQEEPSTNSEPEIASYADDQEATQEAAEAAAVPADGREGLEPAEEGFNDNNIDNDAGVNWEPTEDPESEVTPGEMRSDSEEIPGGFTKEEADRAETQEAEEQSAAGGIGVQATPTNCRTYWPSPFKVCGEIRKKYDAMGGPTSFLTWPRSDEMGVPDGVGRRNEFVNGFIYWHPTHGAHPITTHFSLAYDRNGWEAGGLGYPTSDEFATPNGIGRKQEFSNGAIYGSPAGLAAVQGLIYDKYASLGASEGVLGFPTADEAASNGGGNGRYSIFTGGRIYWHPTHGAHSVRGTILSDWAESGYAGGRYGYPIEDAVAGDGLRYLQKFEHGEISGYTDPFPEIARLLNVAKDGLETFYTTLVDDMQERNVDLVEGFNDLLRHAEYSAEASRNASTANANAGIEPMSIPGAANDCAPAELTKPGNARTNRGDMFYSGATNTVKGVDINHGHNGMFVSVHGSDNVNEINTVEALNIDEGIQLVKGDTRQGVCSPRYISADTDQATRYRAADFVDTKVGMDYDGTTSNPLTYATSRRVTSDSTAYNCASLLWAAYMDASSGSLDIGDNQYLPWGGNRGSVFPIDIMESINTTEFQ